MQLVYLLTQCEIDDGEFEVIFSKPVRKTKKTGYQKRVRICLVDDSGKCESFL